MAEPVLIVPTGSANIASVLAGLRRAGAEGRLSSDPARIAEAERVVVPGVAAFGAAMDQLRRDGVVESLQGRVNRTRPTLAICIGLQILCRESEESPGARGLGLIDARIERFGPGVRSPQFGWNEVEPDPSCAFITSGCAYFANSYRLSAQPPGWSAAWADHGGRFIAALERGNVLACQFHPELSGEWGIDLLRRWIACREGALAC
jgi:glutamine amidotransferase